MFRLLLMTYVLALGPIGCGVKGNIIPYVNAYPPEKKETASASEQAPPHSPERDKKAESK